MIGDRMPPIWPQEAPSSEKLAPQPSKECSDRLLLRVQEGEVDCGFHGSLAAQVGGKPFAQRHLGREGEKKVSGHVMSPPHFTLDYSFPPFLEH